jgi:hypothetical protein
MAAPAPALDHGLRAASLSPSGASLTAKFDQPWSRVDDYGVGAQRCGQGDRWSGSYSPAKHAHKRGDDESLDLLLRLISEFGPHRCEHYPIE